MAGEILHEGHKPSRIKKSRDNLMQRAVHRIGATVRLITFICLFWLMMFGAAYSQSTATIKMDHGEVTAGDKVNMIVSFDSPATCSHQVRVDMVNTDATMQISFGGQLDVGQDIATLTTVVPKDYRNEFHIGLSILYPCQDYSVVTHFTTMPVTLNVRGIPDPNSYPAKANVALSLTQRQFLDTKVAELNDLSVQIDSRVERNGNDSTDLRNFLAGIVEKAEANLQVTERQYKKELLKPIDPLPAFFADFRRQYFELHEELKAPIPGTRAKVEESAHLLYVQQQLKRRSPSDRSQTRNVSRTSPTIARATKATINDNAAAYDIVSSTGKSGRPIFHARFESLPTGATMYYRQVIVPDFTAWSSKTDISGIDFELATFVFKFQKDECQDQPIVTVDPYVNTQPKVSVEFKRCGKR